MPRKRKLIVAGTVVALGAAAVALGSRELNRSSLSSSPRADETQGLVVIGLVADLSGRQRAAGRELVRGVRLWLEHLDKTRGIPYNNNLVAAVRLLVADDSGSPLGAERVAKRLVSQGATVLFGPRDPAELVAVDDVAERTRTLLFSPIPRPTSVPLTRTATFLARPRLADFSAALDVIDSFGRRGRRGRIIVLTARGRWALWGEREARRAGARGYRALAVGVKNDNVVAALSAGRRSKVDAVLVAAPLAAGFRWFKRATIPRNAPWVLAAPDVAQALALSAHTRIAAAVPWSPTTSLGDTFFPPGEFAREYRVVYGRLPSVDAAAGATLGSLLTLAVQGGRSTDPSRMLAARATINAQSMLGVLSLKNGEQNATSPYVVLLDRGRARNIWPTPPMPRLLRLSVPPRVAASP